MEIKVPGRKNKISNHKHTHSGIAGLLERPPSMDSIYFCFMKSETVHCFRDGIRVYVEEEGKLKRMKATYPDIPISMLLQIHHIHFVLHNKIYCLGYHERMRVLEQLSLLF